MDEFFTRSLEEARKFDAGEWDVLADTQLEERCLEFRDTYGEKEDFVFVVEAFIPGCANDYVAVHETLEAAIEDRNQTAAEWYGDGTHVELRWAGTEEDWTGDLAAKRHEDSRGGYAVSIRVEDATSNLVDWDAIP